MKKLISTLLKNSLTEPAYVKQSEKAVDLVEQNVEKLSKSIKKIAKYYTKSADEGSQLVNTMENYSYAITQSFPEFGLVATLLKKTAETEAALDAIKKKTGSAVVDQIYDPWNDLVAKDILQSAKDAKTRYDRIDAVEPEVEAKMILADVLALCEFQLLEKLCLYLEAQKEYYQNSLSVVEKMVPEARALVEKKLADYVRVSASQQQSLKNYQKYFGETLDKILEREKSDIPQFVQKALTYLDNYVKSEGIFRLSGSRAQVILLKTQIDEGHEINLTQYPDPYVIAHLLKQFLRELPEPLLTNKLYKTFLQIGANNTNLPEEELVKQLDTQLRSLPRSNRRLLKVVLKFLVKIAQHSDINKMTVGNLATVIAPNILNTSVNDFENFSYANKVVELMIASYDKLFPDTGEEAEPQLEQPTEPQVEVSNGSSIMEEVNVDVPLSPSTPHEDKEEKSARSSILSLASNLSVKNFKSLRGRNKKTETDSTATASPEPPSPASPRPTKPKKESPHKSALHYVTLRKNKKSEEHISEPIRPLSPSLSKEEPLESSTSGTVTPSTSEQSVAPTTPTKESTTPTTPATPSTPITQSLSNFESEPSSAASSEHHSPANSDNESTISKLKKFGSLKIRGKKDPKPKHPVSAAEIETAMKSEMRNANATSQVKSVDPQMTTELLKLKEIQIHQQKQIEQLQQQIMNQQKQQQIFQQQLEKVTTTLNLPTESTPQPSPPKAVQPFERRISTTELNLNDPQTPDKPLPPSSDQSQADITPMTVSDRSDVSDDEQSSLYISTDSVELTPDEPMARNKRLPGQVPTRRRESMLLAFNDLANF